MNRFSFAILPAVFILAGCASTPPPVAGHYEDWNGGKLEHLDVLQILHMSGYHKVVIPPVDREGLRVTQDNTLVPVEKAIARTPKVIADELDGCLPSKAHVTFEISPTIPTPEKGVLLLKIKLVEFNPGSATARIYSRGFLGATHITLAGEIVDSSTGTMFIKFQHHNYHSQAGLFNLYTEALKDNEEQIADSLRQLFDAFYP